MGKILFVILSCFFMLTSFKSDNNYGKASFYSKEHHGRKTSSGEKFNMYALTAAHRTLKFGTKIKVTNLKNNKSVIVRINDRGPFVPGRILDLSYQAFKEISNPGAGVITIKYNLIN